MTRLVKNFLRGAAGVLDLFPASRHQDYYSRLHKTEADALRQDWERVGQNLWAGLKQASNHVQTQKKEAP
jgi:hypothetical protein